MTSRIHSPYPPLPFTEQRPRGLFIDRWGTLLEIPPGGFCTSYSEVRFLEGAADALFRATCAGWHVYLVGNEPAVAFGQLDATVWLEVQEQVLAHLSSHGAEIKRDYACLDHPKGLGKHRLDSVYHLPNTGAFYHAHHEHGISLEQSWVVGDSTVELVAGWRAGLRLAGVRTGQALRDGAFEVDPDFVGSDLASVVSEVLAHEGAVRR